MQKREKNFWQKIMPLPGKIPGDAHAQGPTTHLQTELREPPTATNRSAAQWFIRQPASAQSAQVSQKLTKYTEISYVIDEKFNFINC